MGNQSLFTSFKNWSAPFHGRALPQAQQTALAKMVVRTDTSGLSLGFAMHSYTRTRIHCMLSCNHALIHAYTHALMHSCTHALMHSCTHALMHSCNHALIHAYTHALMVDQSGKKGAAWAVATAPAVLPPLPPRDSLLISDQVSAAL
jgi:hypothetical protein